MTHRSQMHRNRVHARTNFLAERENRFNKVNWGGHRPSVEDNRKALELFLKKIGKHPEGYKNV